MNGAQVSGAHLGINLSKREQKSEITMYSMFLFEDSDGNERDNVERDNVERDNVERDNVERGQC